MRSTTASKKIAACENAAAFSSGEIVRLRRALLTWYDRHRRTLPWRVAAGERPDPYRVWLSEIMLQQTTVKTVAPYFVDFLARWPTVEALAAASLDDVLHAWQGLGYYARARNLHRCAQAVSHDRGGKFPESEEALRALPGVGSYTAAAIAAIAFDRKATVVDGNVERVVARLFANEKPLPDSKASLRALAETLTPDARPGDHAQAMMDLGAVICTPRRPRCSLCPWFSQCAAHKRGLEKVLPRRQAKPARPLRAGYVFWLIRDGTEVLLRRRPENGLLGGLMELPSTDWCVGGLPLADAGHAAPAEASWRTLPGVVRHGFTHFELELTVLAGKFEETVGRTIGANEGQMPCWCRLDRLSDHALPTVMKKVVEHALANGG
ncbi:MAG TPA: A/G-specific adenine glycosylase [Alphaproteobacteria bacterium]|nr:A/G-specific adenine glycosylase [Alphaproteobacteria bacterium]